MRRVRGGVATRGAARATGAGLATALLLPVYLALAGAILYRSPENAASLSVPDSVEYVVAARHLVEEGRYVVVLDGRVHPSRYLPGFSLFFLAPAYWLLRDYGLLLLPILACSLFSLAFAFRTCRAALPGVAGITAAALFLPLAMLAYWFYEESRQIMSDVPTLALALVAQAAYARARARPRAASFAIGGLLAALAGSVRLTGFALAAPFALLLLRPPARRAGNALVLLLPVGAALLGLLAYDQAVFGHPLFTGYQYWLPPEFYALAPRHAARNLVELLNPFLPPPHARTPWHLVAGPVAVAVVGALALACRRHRREVWERTRPVLAFGTAVGIPLFLFHLFYPHHSARFMLVPHFLALLLAAIWAVALVRSLPAPLLGLAAVASAALAVAVRPPEPVGPDWYKLPFLRMADRVLPPDACLITAFNAMYVEDVWARHTDRCHLPFDDQADYVRWWIGRAGEPREQVLPYTAVEQPERIRALLASGRRVYLEMLQPMWKNRLEARDALLARFQATPVLFLRHKEIVTDPEDAHFEALVELRPRRRPSKAGLDRLH